MQILLACAKTMTGHAAHGSSAATEPAFQQQATHNAMQLAAYSVAELQRLLRTNGNIALENWHRYQTFFNAGSRVPAVFAYDGIAFQRLAPETLTEDELQYANAHLLIGSFLYGLLRPLDLISRYRLEGNVALPGNGGKDMFRFWQPILTDWFIQRIREDGGILVNLASAEFKRIVDWKRVIREVRVVTPDFRVMKDGRAKTVVVYAKMCRGAMARWILGNRPAAPEELKRFCYEGFEYNEASGGWILA